MPQIYSRTQLKKNTENIHSDGSSLSPWTERNVIKYQGHGDVVSGLHSVVRFEILGDSDSACDVLQ